MIGGYGNSISLSVNAYCHFVFPESVPNNIQDTDYLVYLNKSNRCNGVSGGGATCFCIVETINTTTVDFRIFNYELEKLYSVEWNLVAIKLNKSV